MALADGDAEWVLAQDYYGIYPFQLGLAEIFALIFRVAGSTERLVIQQVQAVCGGITLYVGFRIVRELSGSRAAELLYLVAELLFLPVYCYALFIYGESIGTCSVLCAIWCYLMAQPAGGKGVAEGTAVECRRVVHGTGVCDQKCIAGGMDRHGHHADPGAASQ